MPPVPVITQWNTWFCSAIYHANYFEHYAAFVDKVIKDVRSTIQLRKLEKLLNGPQSQELLAELEFIAVHCQQLINTLKLFEGHQFLAFDVYNKVVDLLSWLRTSGFPFATISCELAMTGAALKLSAYVEGNKQPAIDLFKAVRIFIQINCLYCQTRSRTTHKQYQQCSKLLKSGRYTSILLEERHCQRCIKYCLNIIMSPFSGKHCQTDFRNCPLWQSLTLPSLFHQLMCRDRFLNMDPSIYSCSK